jgi:hypothetical protein
MPGCGRCGGEREFVSSWVVEETEGLRKLGQVRIVVELVVGGGLELASF